LGKGEEGGRHLYLHRKTLNLTLLKIFKNYSSLKPLNNLKANFARMVLRLSFIKCMGYLCLFKNPRWPPMQDTF
jgi:hypothetical protein